MTDVPTGYLLDTHALLWALLERRRLSGAVLEVLNDDNANIAVSAVSAVEISIKHRIGKLPEAAPILQNFERDLIADGFEMLSITIEHGLRAGALPIDHKDPFDRLLIAQSICENMVLISNESLFDSFGVRRLW